MRNHPLIEKLKLFQNLSSLGVVLLFICAGCKLEGPGLSSSTESKKEPNPKITATVSPTIIATEDTATMTFEGGTEPITWSITNGPAIVNSEGVVTPTDAGRVRVRVTDSLGEFAEVDLIVRGALTVTAVQTELQIGSSITYTLTGGIPPITATVLEGNATILGPTIFSLGPDGTTLIQFEDSRGATADLSLTVALPITVVSPSPAVPADTEVELEVAGGFSPYTFSIDSGGGTVDADGVFTAPSNEGTTVVRVTDRLGYTTTTSIEILD